MPGVSSTGPRLRGGPALRPARRAGREPAALDALPHLTAAVVHGDLGGENVLWDTSGGLPRLSGVVDWDEGVPARIAARGTFALQQALYALRDGDEEELADGLTGYR